MIQLSLDIIITIAQKQYDIKNQFLTYYVFGKKEQLDKLIVLKKNSIDQASINGNIEILGMWKKSKLQLEYTECAIDFASCDGKIEVLEWWKNSGLPLKYSPIAIDNATQIGRKDVLNWWKQSDLTLQYTENSVDYACQFHKIEMLDWWLNSGLKMKYSTYSIFYASMRGYIDILEWWKRSGLPLIYDNKPMDQASVSGKIVMLNWWLKSGLEIKYSLDFLVKLIITDGSKRKKVLNWWWNTDFDLRDYLIDAVSELGYVDLLQKWKDGGRPFIYTERAMESVSVSQNIEVLDWWYGSGKELKYNVFVIVQLCHKYNSLKVLEWWEKKGLIKDLNEVNEIIEMLNNIESSDEQRYSIYKSGRKNQNESFKKIQVVLLNQFQQNQLINELIAKKILKTYAEQELRSILQQNQFQTSFFFKYNDIMRQYFVEFYMQEIIKKKNVNTPFISNNEKHESYVEYDYGHISYSGVNDNVYVTYPIIESVKSKKINLFYFLLLSGASTNVTEYQICESNIDYSKVQIKKQDDKQKTVKEIQNLNKYLLRIKKKNKIKMFTLLMSIVSFLDYDKLQILLKNKKRYNLKINKHTNGEYDSNEVVEYKTALDVIQREYFASQRDEQMKEKIIELLKKHGAKESD